jgi:hypothetical protein
VNSKIGFTASISMFRWLRPFGRISATESFRLCEGRP